MDPRKSKASEFERRASMRNSRRISVQGGEREAVLDDGDSDFDFAAMAVSDGFRPRESHRLQQPQAPHSLSHSIQRAASISSVASASTPDLHSWRSTPENARPSTSSDAVESPDSTAISQRMPSATQRPSSIAKPPRSTTDSISQRHDAVMGRIQEMATLSREPTGSSISEPYFGQETPYQGPAGPSHPYGMYTQNVRAVRTGSVATTSTTAMGESSFAVSRGPAHPYGMYPQATVDESGVIPAAAAAIPVGFPGMPSQYQRRLGPEGEEIADIIGPDGHTEQLPPYTRYPDETYARKVRDAEQSAVSPSPAVGAAVVGPSLSVPRASIAGAGGIGLATRNPEFEPADDLDSPQSRHSSRSFGTDISHHAINTAATNVVMSEKETPRKKWQAWGKRRLWGIVPYWAICLGVAVLVVMAVVLGAVVGTVLSKQHPFKKPPKKDSSYQYGGTPTVTVTYDATPIPTPTDLPELVTGAFGLPLMTNRVANTCFNDTTQSQAWNCNVLIFAGMTMNVQKNTYGGGGYSISVTCNQSLTLANNVYTYGEQPFIIPSLAPMELVNDTFQPARGPAWFKMVTFNKTVILPEPVLSATPASSAPTQVVGRDFNNAFGTGPGDFKRKGIAQTGDKPWICTWPDTFLEIFIYPQQNSSYSSWNKVSASGTSSSWPSATPAPGSPTSTNTYGGNGAYASNGYPPASSTVGGGSPTTTGPYMPIDTSGWEMPPPPYPRVIKIEERRVDRSPMPSCRQVEITGDGQPAQPVKDANGNDVVIYIVENEPAPPGTPASSELSNNVIENRDSSDMSDCGCMWFIT